MATVTARVDENVKKEVETLFKKYEYCYEFIFSINYLYKLIYF